jgi:diketogulonate reductase-like aldo/keto reductase
VDLLIKGETVPALGFGTWQLRGDDCLRGVADALTIGYRHIDTAQAYENEAEVGQGIKRAGVPRTDIFLVSKVRQSNFHYDDVIRTGNESLQKLDSDYIDLMLLHWPNPDIPLRETLDAMKELQTTGVIRHIGVSNFSAALVDEAALHATIFANQVKYHPYHAQDDLVQQAKSHDYMLTAYSPLARGEIHADPLLQEIGSRYSKSPEQVALRWLIQQGVSAIPKAASHKHRQANFAIFDFELTPEEMRTVDALRKAS